jgi:hypothetical protein
MDHDAVADSGLSILIRAGGDSAPRASPPVIGLFFASQRIHYAQWSLHRH